jgi:ADP-ribosylation factor-binding protein GGA
MKVLAGAVPESKPNYKAQALSELSKLESKVILMNELLDNVKVSAGEGVGEKFVKGDVYDVSPLKIDSGERY